jgi:hypothetical protein
MLKTISADPTAQTTDHTPFFLMVVRIGTNQFIHLMVASLLASALVGAVSRRSHGH